MADGAPLPDLRKLFFSMLKRVNWGECKVQEYLYGAEIFPREVAEELEAAARAYREVGGEWEEYT